MQNKEDNAGSALAAIIYARMKIEMLRVPTFVDMAQALLDEGHSVPIFVNFTESLLTLAEKLGTTCLIHGKQTLDERDRVIADFNADRSRIIICNTRSGGVGISLHDTIGDHMRVSLISPSWSAQDIIQVLGRTFRANGKTPVLQRLIYAKDTVEEQVCKNIKGKINNIAILNDGDTESYKIEGLTTDSGVHSPVTDEDLRKMHIDTLLAKRIRLTESLKETNVELKALGIL